MYIKHISIEIATALIRTDKSKIVCASFATPANASNFWANKIYVLSCVFLLNHRKLLLHCTLCEAHMVK